MIYVIIITFIAFAIGLWFFISDAIDSFDKKKQANNNQPEPQFIQVNAMQNQQRPKPEQVDVLIAIDQKLAQQNRHLATIRTTVAWLLAIAIIPSITSICIAILLVFGSANLLDKLF